MSKYDNLGWRDCYIKLAVANWLFINNSTLHFGFKCHVVPSQFEEYRIEGKICWCKKQSSDTFPLILAVQGIYFSTFKDRLVDPTNTQHSLL